MRAVQSTRPLCKSLSESAMRMPQTIGIGQTLIATLLSGSLAKRQTDPLACCLACILATRWNILDPMQHGNYATPLTKDISCLHGRYQTGNHIPCSLQPLRAADI